MNDVIGYTYSADNYGDECMRVIAQRVLPELGVATMYGDCGSAEDMLSEWARAIGIDRSDEATFDSGEFPKVIYEGMTHKGCTPGEDYPHGTCGDQCGRCGEPLGGECPNIGLLS